MKLLRPVKPDFKPTKDYFKKLDKLYDPLACPKCGCKVFMQLASMKKKRCYDCGELVDG